MEKRIGKLLAGLLMIAMVLTSAAALPIQAAATDAENQGTAEEKKNKVIEVKEITENSIVFINCLRLSWWKLLNTIS